MMFSLMDGVTSNIVEQGLNAGLFAFSFRFLFSAGNFEGKGKKGRKAWRDKG